MEGRDICDAEREASEVLHSLLSIERVKKPEGQDTTSSAGEDMVYQSTQTDFDDLEVVQNDLEDECDSPLEMIENNECDTTLEMETNNECDTPLEMDTNNECDTPLNVDKINEQMRAVEGLREDSSCSPVPAPRKRRKTPPEKRLTRLDAIGRSEDDSPQDVIDRFKQGCECGEDTCFRGFNPESVYKHRLNIAELTKEEHDMYLMGVTMACLADPAITSRKKERQRLRSQYVYHGRKVCLSAFLFLENCTLYQLKRIRKHVVTQGVTPRVHGNHGKKPHNVFSLETYRRATDFLRSYIEHYTKSAVNLKLPVSLPPDKSRKTIHSEYYEHMRQTAPPGEKVMGYSTFRHFMKEQFPNVRFCKTDLFLSSTSSTSGSNTYKNIAPAKPAPVPIRPRQEAVEVNNVVAPPQLTSTPVILSDVGKTDIGPTYIFTQLQPIQEFTTFQPQTIAVAPLPPNATYAFTTMQL